MNPKRLVLTLLTFSIAATGPFAARALWASKQTRGATTTAPQVVFAVFGGVGVIPSNANPDDFYSAVAVVQFTRTAAEASQLLTVRRLEILDASGVVLAASTRGFSAIERVPAQPATTQWAQYLNPPGIGFTGTLPAGVSHLRIRASLDHRPRGAAARCRVTVTDGTRTVVLEGPMMGEWPT